MTDVNPMTQPLSPIERESRLLAIRNRCDAMMKLVADGAPSMTDEDVRDIDNDTAEIESKWIDRLIPFYDQRLSTKVNLDADPNGTDYKMAVNVAMVAASFMSTNTPQDEAIRKAATLIQESYKFIQSTDDPDQPQG